jgi:predicted DNA-binding transcriptional regulator AlpA
MAKRINTDTELADIRERQLPPSLLDHRIINKKTAAAMCGLSERVLDKRIRAGQGPRFVQLGVNKKGFAVRDLKEWLRSLEGEVSAA